MAYTFLRWLRTGIAASLGPQSATATASRASIAVGIEVEGTDLPPRVGSVNLGVLGPQDVTGLDARQVVRTFPVAGAVDFEPTFFPHVEFSRPDLPWLFTPFGPAANHTLRPWLGLVVVEKGEYGRLSPGAPCPTLTVSGPEIAALPPLNEAHAWAHVQIVGDAAPGAKVVMETAPERIVSRLVCPRALAPGKSYLACVVPTFRKGALAGLGRDVPATAPLDAWTAADTTVDLPVYYSWEFSTGAGGDFRSLVLRLESRAQPQGVGTRPLDVSMPGFGLPDRTAAPSVPLGGALRVAQAEAPLVDPVFASDLLPLVNADAAVGPPIYGRWHAAVTGVASPVAGAPGWVDTLNLDPRYRVAAGLGTSVVQERQEDLMAAIWEQLGEVLRANQLLRQAQLAIAASERVVTRHLAPLSDPALLSIAGPALSRILAAPRTTARKVVRDSCLPLVALSGAFRRVTRARGPIARRLMRASRAEFPDRPPAPVIDLNLLLSRMAAGALVPRAVAIPPGAIPVPASVRRPNRRRTPAPGGDAHGTTGGPLASLERALALLEKRAVSRRCPALDVSSLATDVRGALVPDVAIAARVRAQISVPKSLRVRLSVRLDPIMATPDIPTPMIGPLQEMGQDWLLPGLSSVGANTATIVEPDAAFIEAYMVGLNHEMSRELLWRGFPTDQRGTVFARFWDRRAAVPTAAAAVPDRDIPPIHEWDTSTALGGHLSHGAQDLVVLLIRGDLLHRYPRATIYVQRARWRRDTAGVIVFEGGRAVREPVVLSRAAAWDVDARFPVFSGRSGGDIVFLGFPLTTIAIRGVERDVATSASPDTDAGWYVVFEEQPTEPRFGTGTTPLPSPLTLQSDALAATLLRPSFRLFVHASDLLAP